MSAEKKYTEREKVVAERRAFIAGMAHESFDSRHVARRVPAAEAEQRYPLPTVTRPRVVTLTRCDHCSPMQFRFVDDKLEWREADVPSEWKRCNGELYLSSPAFLIELGKLAANPTEVCDAE